MPTDEPVEAPDPDDARDASDVVEGPVGGASLREPSEIEAEGAGADLESLPDIDDGTSSRADES